jgi:hypothetical protein
VSAVGSTSNATLGDALDGALHGTSVAIYRIGDCVKPRRILEAMREGFERAYAL